MHKAALLRVLVADDESIARHRLLQFLGGEPDVEVIAQCIDGAATCRAIGELRPDLVFLDVEMPELNGLDVVARIGAHHMPATVFATAYDHYAVAAFDANAVDYLVKPFDRPRFARAMARARMRLADGSVRRAELAGMLDMLSGPGRLLIRDGTGEQLIKIDDILYVKAEGNYVRIHAGAEPLQMRETLAGMLERLGPARFRRIHRSHIVNLDYVRKILPWFGGDSLVMMADGCRLTMSRTYRAALAEFACG